MSVKDATRAESKRIDTARSEFWRDCSRDWSRGARWET